ncbi:hypothetical protein DEU56DRAFT_912609 [Suillus clintonianus]|uniref:uncharacterized protein n=1 Tax=Suillus clintonianus TaxID=1904413 RepID=UPI001B85FE93|nr:uncharacterized protein DEU56DRAFT_912609 [Suillus clintonianus]KAG2137973.1 hypothetical protein DEU56DRAFT_912609 [Suillus clintonianus]
MATGGFFKGDTHMEVVTIIANSGHDVDAVREAVTMYIVAKKKKGCSEQRIHEKLGKLEIKFKNIEALHPAWRDARALFQLCKSDHIPIPMSIVHERENAQRRQLEWESSSMAPLSPAASSASPCSSSSASNRLSSVASLSSGPSLSTSVPSTSNSPLRLSWDSPRKEDLSRDEEDPTIGHHVPSRVHPSRHDTALTLLSEYSDESEPDEQVLTPSSGNPHK